MKALLQYRASPGFRDRLRDRAPEWLEVAVVDETDTSGFEAHLGDTDVLLHVLEPVTADVLARAPRLRLVQKIGVGVNTIDLEAARERGIAVANMPGTNSVAVAELTLALLLAALRRIPTFDAATRAGHGWEPDLAAIDAVGEVRGRTVGLVGYGEVARRLAPVLAAMGATVLYTARTPRTDAVGAWRELDALFTEADVVSLHLPLTEDTTELVDRARIATMKRGAVLVNTARGGLVDEHALVDALRSGHLGAAGLDVFAHEPVEVANPLLTLPNVVVLPHLAWLTPETLDRSLDVAIENCRRVRDGEELRHRVC